MILMLVVMQQPFNLVQTKRWQTISMTLIYEASADNLINHTSESMSIRSEESTVLIPARAPVLQLPQEDIQRMSI